MRPGARIKAGIEILDDILARHRPAATALSDWGKAHRFAGSGDRSAIGSLVFDALRRKQSIAARMGADTPRALALGAALSAFAMAAEDVAAAADGSTHAPAPLSAEERAGLARGLAHHTPAFVAGDFPEWLAPSFERVFGPRAAAEGAALAARAPIDLRTNTLKASRAQVLEALADYGAVATPLSPIGVRIPAPEGRARAPHVEAEAAHGRGWFEVQDEASQIAALLAGAAPGMTVLDLCAGAGGKTLALAAAMGNTGQIHAWDADKRQLRPIFERLQRAGVTNVEVLDAGKAAALDARAGQLDLVVVDAPCTGSGTWRRRPDSKWRLKPAQLADRQADQQGVLARAAGLVRPGGQIAYITCSVLAEENTDSVARFLAVHPRFRVRPFAEVWRERLATPPPDSADGRADGLLLTPARHGTDGFYMAILHHDA